MGNIFSKLENNRIILNTVTFDNDIRIINKKILSLKAQNKIGLNDIYKDDLTYNMFYEKILNEIIELNNELKTNYNVPLKNQISIKILEIKKELNVIENNIFVNAKNKTVENCR